MTMVPLMVVADKISGLKKIGIVPKMVKTTIAILPRPIFKALFGEISILYSLEKEEKTESKVEAAEVIMMKFIISNITGPKYFATSTAACPFIPLV